MIYEKELEGYLWEMCEFVRSNHYCDDCPLFRYGICNEEGIDFRKVENYEH